MSDNLTEAIHGGNLRAVAEKYNVDIATLLDFSANINPLGPPPEVACAIAAIARGPGRLTTYPDPTARPLCDALGMRMNVDPKNIAVGNGAASVLQAALRATKAMRCILPVPAFSEYRKIATAEGMPVLSIPLRSDFTPDITEATRDLKTSDALILSNPHNPSGALTRRDSMEHLIDRCEEQRAAVIIDEAFIDYAPHATSLGRAMRYNRAIIVRSLTKFYAIPGIRVGYAISQMAGDIRRQFPSWPVGACDIEAALAALTASRYDRETIETNSISRDHLEQQLHGLGIATFPPSANFILAELPIHPTEMDEFLESLIRKQGIVVRDCRDYDTLQNRSLIRIAVRSTNDNQRCLTALAATLPSRTTQLRS